MYASATPLLQLAATVNETTGGFFTSPSGVVTLAVLCVLASGTAGYLMRTVPKQMMIQVQVRDALLGNKDHKQPGLIEDVAQLKIAFQDHLAAREQEMNGIHADIADIHTDLAQIKEIVMPTRSRFRRW